MRESQVASGRWDRFLPKLLHFIGTQRGLCGLCGVARGVWGAGWGDVGQQSVLLSKYHDDDHA